MEPLTLPPQAKPSPTRYEPAEPSLFKNAGTKMFVAEADQASTKQKRRPQQDDGGQFRLDSPEPEPE